MSQKESFLLPDGRRTSELKVTELRKELDKLGKSKSGNKSELLTRLNESFQSTPLSSDEISANRSIDTANFMREEYPPVDREETNRDDQVGGDSGIGEALEDERVVSIARLETEAEEREETETGAVRGDVRERGPVDLDAAADDNQTEPTEINQSVDALDLFVPIDDSLNPVTIDDISNTISNNNTNNGNDTSVCDKSSTEDLRTVTVLNESQDQPEISAEKPTNNNEEIIDLEETQIDMYDETDQIDLMELDEETKQIESKPKKKDRERERDKEKDREKDKEKHKEREKDRERKRKREKREKSDPHCFVDSTLSTETAPAIVTESPEDGEVVSVPITARLGKRKTDNSENNSTNNGSMPTTTVIAEEQSLKMGNDVNSSGVGQLSSENIEKSIDGSSHNSKRSNKRTSAGQSGGGLKETKASGYTIDNVERVQPAQRSRHSQTECVRVDNLVRPFTQGQLTDMLSKHGRVTDIWLNKIKSIAYVRYESGEAAERAREGLDGCKWPSINPKLLCCDFVSQREMDWMKEKGDTASGAPPAVSSTVPLVNNSNSSTAVANSNSNNNNQSTTRERKRPRDNINNEGTLLPPAVPPTHSDNNNKRSRRGPSPTGDHHRHSRNKPIENISNNPGVNNSSISAKSAGTDNHSHSQPSQQQQSHHHRQSRHNNNNTASTHNTNTNTNTHRDKSRDRNMRHTGAPGNHQHHHHQQQQHKSASPVGNPPAAPAPSAAKMLEDIFRKTVTQPAIYWLPVIRDKKEETVAVAPAKKAV